MKHTKQTFTLNSIIDSDITRYWDILGNASGRNILNEDQEKKKQDKILIREVEDEFDAKILPSIDTKLTIYQANIESVLSDIVVEGYQCKSNSYKTNHIKFLRSKYVKIKLPSIDTTANDYLLYSGNLFNYNGLIHTTKQISKINNIRDSTNSLAIYSIDLYKMVDDYKFEFPLSITKNQIPDESNPRRSFIFGFGFSLVEDSKEFCFEKDVINVHASLIMNEYGEHKITSIRYTVDEFIGFIHTIPDIINQMK